MERLTKRYCVETGCIEYLLNPKIKTPTQAKIFEACQKLGKLEDLEEKIGMSLKDLFNVVGKDIYVINLIKNTYYGFTINTLYLDNSIYYLGYVDSTGLDMCFKSNDFNKTWFLTREEAEKKLEEKWKR